MLKFYIKAKLGESCSSGSLLFHHQNLLLITGNSAQCDCIIFLTTSVSLLGISYLDKRLVGIPIAVVGIPTSLSQAIRKRAIPVSIFISEIDL